MQQRQLQGDQNLGMNQTTKGGSERYNRKEQGCTTKQGEKTLGGQKVTNYLDTVRRIRHFQMRWL